eukprot:s7284_g1.t1
MKVPRNARICASRVVEYVPQYDEQLTPRTFVPADRLTPVSTAVPAEAEEDPAPDDKSDYTPSFAGDDVAVDDVAKLAAELEADILEGYEPPPKGVRVSHDDVRVIVPEEAAEPSAPSHPLDDKLLVELGYEDLAVAVETDPKVNALVSELLDPDHLLTQALKLEDPHCPSQEVQAMVTKLLSRAEMLSNPKALEAVKAEADGLLRAGTWDLSSVREKEDVRAEAKKSGVSVHFGQLMTIASIKFHELAEHLQKMKGRIVYRGDCAKDEHGAAAVYQELRANPTSVQGLNACLAYGTLPGHCSTAADAVKAY